jgi:hypothetical protein
LNWPSLMQATVPGSDQPIGQQLQHQHTATVNAGQDPRLFAGEVSDLILG